MYLNIKLLLLPPVLDEPVVLSIDGCAITHQQQSMVQFPTAALTVPIYTTRVELE